jgi:hypothetical protein
MAINRDFTLTQHAFMSLVGEGISYKQASISADTFKNRNPKLLGEIIEETAIILKERTKNIEFEEWEETGEEMPYAVLNFGIERISEIGNTLKSLKTLESSDLDWLLIGELVRITAALLNHIKKNR